jgi:hypothetical protein
VERRRTPLGVSGRRPHPGGRRLIRLDVERHRVLEERVVSPAEASGAIYLRDIAISPDGRSVAYIYGRNVGYLYVLRGLLRPGR